MQQWFDKMEVVNVAEVKLVGSKDRTCEKDAFDPKIAKVSEIIGKYWTIAFAEKIPNLISPEKRYAVYSNRNAQGEYDYFFGQEVSSFDEIPAGLTTMVIPACTRTKFTTVQGRVPDIMIEAWNNIHGMSEEQLKGKLSFEVDFEVYDERARDLGNAVVDIYVGTK